MTTKSTMIHARVSPELKDSAEKILHKLGMTSTEAIRLYYTQIIIKKGIPFNINIESDDNPDEYIKITDKEHLKSLIGLK